MRFAAVGLGNAITMFHVPALRRIPGAELVGGCDLSADRRFAWQSATGSSRLREPRRAARTRAARRRPRRDASRRARRPGPAGARSGLPRLLREAARRNCRGRRRVIARALPLRPDASSP